MESKWHISKIASRTTVAKGNNFLAGFLTSCLKNEVSYSKSQIPTITLAYLHDSLLVILHTCILHPTCLHTYIIEYLHTCTNIHFYLKTQLRRARWTHYMCILLYGHSCKHANMQTWILSHFSSCKITYFQCCPLAYFQSCTVWSLYAFIFSYSHACIMCVCEYL